MDDGWMNGGSSYDSFQFEDNTSVPRIEAVHGANEENDDAILGIDSVYNNDSNLSNFLGDDIDIDIDISSSCITNSWTNNSNNNGTKQNSLLSISSMSPSTKEQNKSSEANGKVKDDDEGEEEDEYDSEVSEVDEEDVLWKCARCDLEFPDREGVKNHVEAVHKKEKQNAASAEPTTPAEEPTAFPTTPAAELSNSPVYENNVDFMDLGDADNIEIVPDLPLDFEMEDSMNYSMSPSYHQQVESSSSSQYLPVTMLAPYSTSYIQDPNTSLIWAAESNFPNPPPPPPPPPPRRQFPFTNQIPSSVLNAVNRGIRPRPTTLTHPPIIIQSRKPKPKAPPKRRASKYDIVIPNLSETAALDNFQPVINNVYSTTNGILENTLRLPSFNDRSDRRFDLYDNGRDYSSLPAPKLPSVSVTPVKFVCYICDTICRSENDLKRHLEIFKDYKPSIWKCQQCEKRFIHDDDWKKHEHFTLPEKKVWKCYCSRTFSDEYILYHHEIKHNKKKQSWKCSCCPRIFDTLPALKTHQFVEVKKFKRPGYKCTSCPQLYPTYEERNAHMKTHEVSLKCTQCDKVFNSLSKLQNHTLVEHISKPWPCTNTNCKENFLEKTELEIHMKEKHNTTDDKATCEKCGKKFGRAAALKQHKMICLKTAAAAEEDDDDVIIEKDLRKDKTYRSGHSNSNNKKNNTINNMHCKACKKDFTDKETYQRHMKKHDFLATRNKQQQPPTPTTTRKPTYASRMRILNSRPLPNLIPLTTTAPNVHYKCAICYKIFPNKEYLRLHAQCHPTEKKFKCTQLDCKELFSTPQQRTQHLLQVHGLTSQVFKCKDCSQTFEKQRELDRHELTHETNEPADTSYNYDLSETETKFTCPECGKSFLQEGLLEMHKKDHAPDQSEFNCKICKKKFKNMASLNMHSKKSHPESVAAAIEEIVLD